MNIQLQSSDAWSVALNLLSSFIAFICGAALTYALAVKNRWLQPRFWKRLMSDELVIVIGSHDGFDGWEASGMVGVGDALALAEVSSYLRERAFTKFRVLSSSTIAPDDLNKHLIMLGGPDANSVSRSFVEKTADQSKIVLGDPDRNIVSFSFDGKYYSPTRGQKSTDAGAIIFCRSPFNPDAASLLLSGCFGIGTLAAAKTVCRSRSFQRKVGWSSKFEAAVTCEVKGNFPVGTKVEQIIR